MGAPLSTEAWVDAKDLHVPAAPTQKGSPPKKEMSAAESTFDFPAKPAERTDALAQRRNAGNEDDIPAPSPKESTPPNDMSAVGQTTIDFKVIVAKPDQQI